MTGMHRGTLFVLTLLVAAPLVAAPPRKATPKRPSAPAPEQKLIQNCDAHKFETVVDTMVDGQPRKSKVKLCGVEGQSDAEWIGTLKDAIRKVEANKEMPGAQREQIVAAINAEIGRLSIVGTPVAPVKRQVAEQSLPSLSRDYATLPPLPPAPEAPIAAPAPAAPVEAAIARAVATPPPPGVLAVPRLKISCEVPTDFAGPAPCAEFERETRLTIQPEADVPPGVALQFVRNGRVQGELSLGGLGKGASLRSSLPQSVCAGFGAGRLELRIAQAGGAQVVRSEGTYSLRCY
jgi:hypothetical protein